MNDILFANVIIDLTHEALDKPFIYIIPIEFKNKIKIGDKVIIEFGKGNREIEGFVIEIFNREELINSNYYKNDKFFQDENNINNIKYIKNISEKKISVNSVLIQIAKFMSDEYMCSLSRCLKTVLPIKKIVNKNKNQIDAIIKYKNDFDEKNIFLTEEQKKIISDIIKKINKNEYSSHLVFGVTGSGKTEVYLNLIKHALTLNKNIIVLIPEISLTYQTMSRLKSRFGEKVAVIHSKMGEGNKYIQIKKCIDGRCKILVGPRSAIFAPFENVGLIVIDEEDDDSYKSDLSPRYDARFIAEYRAKIENATVVRFSATPSINSFYKTNNNMISLHTLTKRTGNIKMPNVDIVDMRKEYKYGNKTIFSKLLYDKINSTLKNKEQILLFINRRGLSKSITCIECGYSIKCPHCDVSLTLHNDSTLKCHYCGYEEIEPIVCPNCKSNKLNAFGMGTQKLEEQLIKNFIGVRVLRMDKDTTINKDSHETIIKKFKNNEADILIGTQMVVKGHDFPNLTLVGIMCADMSFSIQNYKATEKAFQLIMQAAGRSGRKKNGDCIIQAYNIEDYPLIDIKNNDYLSFYNKEINFRREFTYPPFCSMLIATLRSLDEQYLLQIVLQIKNILIINNKQIEILGPTKPNPSKIKDYFYYMFYIKCKNHLAAKDIRNNINQIINNIDKMKFVNIMYDIEE